MTVPIPGVSGVLVPDVGVRVATPEDSAELARLIRLADIELDGRKGAWLRKRFDVPAGSVEEVVVGFLHHDDSTTLIGTVDGVVVGFVAAHVASLHEASVERADAFSDAKFVGVIDGLYVEPDGRSVSVGDALVVAMLDHYRDGGCAGVDAWALPGERETKNFYEAHAFSARSITVHHSFVGPTHVSRTEGLRGLPGSDEKSDEKSDEEV